MINYIRKKLKSENLGPFLHFTTVFTIIFLVMTIIIIQIMRLGLYSSADNNLKEAKNASSLYIDSVMSRSYSIMSDNYGVNITIGPNKLKSGDHMMASLDVILYDSKGQILNKFDAYSRFADIQLNKKQLNNIISQTLISSYGHSESYRSLTIKEKNLTHPQVSYVSFLISTKQLDDAFDSYVKVIIYVMLFFWFISVITSVYLAKWSRKPIIASYRRQKTFVENASHELRTPLAVLQNRLETLFRKPNDIILDHSANIAASLEEVRNMRFLTSNLLNLARRDDGIKVNAEMIKPQFFTDMFENYRLIAEEEKKEFKASNGINSSIKSDKVLLKQLLTILFDNALKYTDRDGKIYISIQNKERRLMIRVEDNGIGISDLHKDKIFDRFYRVDKARTRQKGGFGLGLSMAKQIVDCLGGKIVVKDNIPKGTIFEIIL